eukprot:1559646-Alexandrium_andersonii.AAC.1
MGHAASRATAGVSVAGEVGIRNGADFQGIRRAAAPTDQTELTGLSNIRHEPAQARAVSGRPMVHA